MGVRDVRIYPHDQSIFPSAERLGGAIENGWRCVFSILAKKKILDWEALLGTLSSNGLRSASSYIAIQCSIYFA
jgi:hypothetical protein